MIPIYISRQFHMSIGYIHTDSRNTHMHIKLLYFLYVIINPIDLHTYDQSKFPTKLELMKPRRKE